MKLGWVVKTFASFQQAHTEVALTVMAIAAVPQKWAPTTTQTQIIGICKEIGSELYQKGNMTDLGSGKGKIMRAVEDCMLNV